MADPFTPRFIDLVRNFTSTSGTGNLVLGATAPGFTGFAEALEPGDRFYYSVVGLTVAEESEVGRGTLAADGSIVREPIAGSPTSFSTGLKSVALVAAAEWFDTIEVVRGAPAPVATRAEIAALTATGAALLSENDREGLFLFDGANLSDAVAADGAQGIYIAPSADASGASGAWVRQFTGPVDPCWFGVVEGDDSALGTGNCGAILAMWAALRGRAHNVSGLTHSLDQVRFPPGTFWLADNGTGAGIELVDGTVILEGSGGSHASGRPATLIKVPAGVTAIRVQSSDTAGAGGTAPSHVHGSGSTLRNFGIEGPFRTSGTESEGHGIHLRARCDVECVSVRYCEGDGFNIEANTTTVGGNANVYSLSNCLANYNRNGLRVSGNNANAGITLGFNANLNRQWGVWESSWGSTHIGAQIANWGYGETGSPSSVVHFNGNRYFVINKQEAGASTNAPTGNATDNMWWGWLEAGGPVAEFPEWVSGASYRAGGSYCADSLLAKNCAFLNCYDESNGSRSQVAAPATVLGGFLSIARWAGADAGWGPAPKLASNSAGGQWKTDTGIVALSGTVATQLGGTGKNPNYLCLVASEPTIAPSGLQFRFRPTHNDFGLYRNNNVTSGQIFEISCDSTTAQFGTGAPFVDAFWPRNLMVGDSKTNARQLTNGTAAPASGAFGIGSWSLDRGNNPNLIGRKCIAAGSPGGWGGDLYGLGSLTVFESGLAVGAPDMLLGRSSAGAGSVEEIACTAAGRALLDDADAASQRTTLGLADIAVSGSGADLAQASVSYAKIQNVSAPDKLLGRVTAGPGPVEEIACTAAGRALIDAVDAAAQRTTLGVVRGLGFHCAGAPAGSETIGGMIAPYAFTISQANSACKALVAATAAMSISIRKNGTEIGTFSFAAGASSATVTVTTAAVAANDQITFHAPSAPDATLADIDGLVRE